MPALGFSVRSAVRLLKDAFGITDIRITGEITIQKEKGKDNQIRLVLRSNNKEALQPDPIIDSDLTHVIREGGEALLRVAYPCIAASYYYRRETYYRREMITGSFPTTKQFIDLCRKDRNDVRYVADFLLGLIAYQDKQYPDAIKHYKDASDRAPEEANKADTYFHWGRALQQQNKLAEAKDRFNDAKKADQDYVNAYFGLASLAAGDERASEVKQLGELCERNHDKATDCGNAYLNLGVTDDAIANYRRALVRNPQRPADIHVLLGHALLDKKNPQDSVDAIENYRKAIELQQDHVIVHNNLEVALYSLTSRVIAHNNLGVALYSLTNYAEAIEEFRKVIGLDKDFIDTYYNYGMAITRLHENNEPGRVSDAIEQYKSAIRDDPRLAAGYFLSGIANFNIRNPREAIEDFEQYDRPATDGKSADFYDYWGNALLQLAERYDAS